MEAIRKQASKLREQVAKQQQDVFNQFGCGYGGTDNIMAHDEELQQHQKLKRLYMSTRAGKHFQRDIVRGAEGLIVTGSKQMQIGSKLSENGRKYGSENTCTSRNTLSKAALCFSTARAQMEKEHEILLKSLGTQVADPLRAMVVGAPLEDARHLAQKYDRLRQEAEAQAIEVSRRQDKVRESTATADNYSKLEAAEVRLHELKGNVAILGKEAAAAMAAVEAQQQRLTLQRLISMVESERNFHHRVLQILNQLEGDMALECQHIDGSSPTSAADNYRSPPPPYDEVNDVFASPAANGPTESMGYFLGEVINRFHAVSDVELSLSVGDYIVVRKVSNNGWAEGECKGEAGWFTFGYIERRDRVLSKLQQHQKLERLYISTRAGKHFQRDIVRGAEGYIVYGSKQIEIDAKLSENSRKYGSENTCTSGNTLSKAALCFSRARAQMEKEHGILLKSLGTQVAEPLRAMVVGAPLEDARHLAQKYDRLRQEAEAQAIEVSRRQAKVRESTATADDYLKLEGAEVKLHGLKRNVAILGKEAAAAMAAVEAQQQRLTLQRLISMVESERNFHHKVLQILDQLEGEMTLERQHIDGSSPSLAADNHMPPPPPPPYNEVNDVFASPAANGPNDSMRYFLGEVINRFHAVSDVELSLSVGDYIVVRKVSNNGWAEGECKGEAGWFPFNYIERRDRVLASKVFSIYT